MQRPRFPPEILHQIVEKVDGRCDLVHAAGACRTLRALVRPFLDYWAIRTDLHHSGLWEKLSRVDDVGASRIRSLTVISFSQEFERCREDLYEKDRRVPPDAPPFPTDSSSKPSKEMIISAQGLLAGALRRMINLEHFVWHGETVPLMHREGGIWDALQSLGTIQSFDIYEMGLLENYELSDSNTSLGMGLCRAFLTRANLRELQVCIHWEDDTWLNLEGIQSLALACPNLEVLALDMGPDEQGAWDCDEIDHLMNNALWPKLRILKLEGFECASDVLMRFLIAHPSLEHLRLAFPMLLDNWDRSPSLFSLPEDALPNLHTLQCSSAQAVHLLSGGHRRAMRTLLGVDVLERVILDDYLAGVDDPERGGMYALERDWEDPLVPMISPWRTRLMDCLRETPWITHIGVSGPLCGRDGFPRLPDFQALAEAAPKIKQLTVAFTEVWSLPPQAEMIQIWACFPALERIGRYRADEHRLPTRWSAFTPADVAYISDLLRKVLAVCSKLEILEIEQMAHGSEGKIIILRADGAGGTVNGDSGRKVIRWVGRRRWEGDQRDLRAGEICYEL